MSTLERCSPSSRQGGYTNPSLPLPLQMTKVSIQFLNIHLWRESRLERETQLFLCDEPDVYI